MSHNKPTRHQLYWTCCNDTNNDQDDDDAGGGGKTKTVGNAVLLSSGGSGELVGKNSTPPPPDRDAPSQPKPYKMAHQERRQGERRKEVLNDALVVVENTRPGETAFILSQWHWLDDWISLSCV